MVEEAEDAVEEVADFTEVAEVSQVVPLGSPDGWVDHDLIVSSFKKVETRQVCVNGNLARQKAGFLATGWVDGRLC